MFVDRVPVVPAGLWELYLLRTGRHPDYVAVRRA
jgi:hypothetical protein